MKALQLGFFPQVSLRKFLGIPCLSCHPRCECQRLRRGSILASRWPEAYDGLASKAVGSCTEGRLGRLGRLGFVHKTCWRFPCPPFWLYRFGTCEALLHEGFTGSGVLAFFFPSFFLFFLPFLRIFWCWRGSSCLSPDPQGPSGSFACLVQRRRARQQGQGAESDQRNESAHLGHGSSFLACDLPLGEGRGYGAIYGALVVNHVLCVDAGLEPGACGCGPSLRYHGRMPPIPYRMACKGKQNEPSPLTTFCLFWRHPLRSAGCIPTSCTHNAAIALEGGSLGELCRWQNARGPDAVGHGRGSLGRAAFCDSPKGMPFEVATESVMGRAHVVLAWDRKKKRASFVPTTAAIARGLRAGSRKVPDRQLRRQGQVPDLPDAAEALAPTRLVAASESVELPWSAARNTAGREAWPKTVHLHPNSLMFGHDQRRAQAAARFLRVLSMFWRPLVGGLELVALQTFLGVLLDLLQAPFPMLGY